jgi:hypothetical protein
MSPLIGEDDRSGGTRRDYEAPKLVVLGSVAELTQGAANSGADIVFSGGIPSDRALKDHVRPVEPRQMLDTLAAL